MNDIAMEAKGVDFSYYDGFALRDVSLSLRVGDLVGLIGPNGSGKTTLIRVLSGLLAPKRGHVYLDGQDIRELSRRQIARRVAVVPQGLAMPFAFTTYEMVMLGRTPHVRPLVGVGPRDREVVREAMALTDTDRLAQRLFNELSAGEQQRVIVAMALAQEPRILLLDEPFSNLDPESRERIPSLISRLHEKKGWTTLVVTHDIHSLLKICRRVLVMNDGRILVDDTPEQALKKVEART